MRDLCISLVALMASGIAFSLPQPGSMNLVHRDPESDVPAPLLGIAAVNGFVKPARDIDDTESDVPAPLLGIAAVNGFVKPARGIDDTESDVPAPLLGIAAVNGFVKPARDTKTFDRDIEDVSPPC